MVFEERQCNSLIVNDTVVGSILVSPSANLIIRVRDHTSASSGAGPMELVSMACPSVVRGRIIVDHGVAACI
jgi:hypothetical protein